MTNPHDQPDDPGADEAPDLQRAPTQTDLEAAPSQPAADPLAAHAGGPDFPADDTLSEEATPSVGVPDAPNSAPPMDLGDPLQAAPAGVDRAQAGVDAGTEVEAGAGRSPLAILRDVLHVPLFAPTSSDRLWRWGTIFAIFALYLLNAGSFGLWDPWETHYGEVTRNMVETFDWVNPWWGYQRKIGTEPIGGEWFYSKPIFIFWAECTFVKLIGLSDWALRLPQALLGASAASSVFLAVERIVSRRAAFWAATVLALSPFFYMVARQAQTDMPFVATLTIGMMFLLTSILGRRQALTPGRFLWATVGFVAFMLANLLPQFAIIATDLYDPNTQDLASTIQQNGWLHVALFYAPATLALVASVLVPVWRQRRAPGGWGDEAFVDKSFRRYLLLCSYMLLAQATYAKGLLGFMLPGAVLVLYLIVSRQWRLLRHLELVRGVPLFFVTVMPWYVAMFCRHGMPYYQRFFIHDHFNRVGAGVHQIDTGTFEYFVEWLGYGLWPWSAFAPLAVAALLAAVRSEPEALLPADARQPGESTWARADAAALRQLRSFAVLWFLVSFILFTLSSTRFHHYILPGVPPLAMITGIYLLDLVGDRRAQARLPILLALALLLVVTAGVAADFQNLRSLFTYKYDRPMPENMPFDWFAQVVWPSDAAPIQTWAEQPFGRHVGPMVANILNIGWFRFDIFWKIAGGLAATGILAMLLPALRRVGLVVVTVAAALAAFWALNYYMPSLAPHWSQKYLFEKYYEDCHIHPNPGPVQEAFTPLVSRVGLGAVAEFFDARPKRVCSEDIVSWLITWRGETYYSNNEIRPLNKATQLGPYLQEMNRGKTFYVLSERGRTTGLESKLKGESRKLRDSGVSGFAKVKDWNCDVLSNDSAYFVLAKCVPVSDDGAGARVRPTPVPPGRRAAPSGDAPEPATSPNPNF